MICPSCGANNEKESKFCGSCGFDLAASEEKTTVRRMNWILQLVCVFLITALSFGFVFFLYSQNSAIADIDFSELFSKEKISTGRISNRDFDQALEIARLYGAPPKQEDDQLDLSLEELGDNSSRYDLERIHLIGEVAAVESTEDLLESDWSEAWIIKLTGSDEEFIVIYRGDGGRISPGDTLEVDGVFYAEHEGLLAYNIRHLSSNPFTEEEDLLWLYRLLILCVIWFIFSLGFICRKSISRKIKGYQNLSILIVFLLASFLISGCEIVMSTQINEDGSGTVSTSLIRAKEDLEFIREIPEMTAYLDALMQDFRQQGVEIENIINGEQEVFAFQRDFQSLEQVFSESDLLSGESWFEVEKFEDGDDMVYRYYGELNTIVLYDNLENLPSYALDEITEELDASDFVFYLSLPGEVTYTNGLPAAGGRLEWEIRNNDINQIVAESRVSDTQKLTGSTENRKGILIIAAGALFILSNMIFLIALLSFRKANNKKRERQ